MKRFLLAVFLLFALTLPMLGALNFTADGQKVDCGSAAVLDNLDPFTVLMWVHPTSTDATAHLYTKPPAGSGGVHVFRRSSGVGNDLTFVRTRVTTTTFYQTNDTPLSTSNKWYFIAVVFDTGASAGEIVNISVGDLTTAPVESTYGTSDDGAGALNTDASNNLIIGATGDSFNSWSGHIAYFQMFTTAMTPGEIKAHWFRTFGLGATDTVLYVPLGFNGTGTQDEWSGNGNTCTIVGSPAVIAHVPLPQPF